MKRILHTRCVINVFVCAKEILHVVFIYMYMLFVLMKIPYAVKAMHIYKNTFKWASNI